jgi:hypothetical protein
MTPAVHDGLALLVVIADVGSPGEFIASLKVNDYCGGHADTFSKETVTFGHNRLCRRP